jgi:tRNA(adenine34) deaminase
MRDEDFLKMALDNSRKSMRAGNFPAGAVVAKDGKILSSEVSSPYPGLLHADSKAMSAAFQKHGSLKGATLYVGLEPCLMCSGVAYWSGIRRVVYAVPKAKVSGSYYETHQPTGNLIENFNEKIEFVHLAALEEEALWVIREWESKAAI